MPTCRLTLWGEVSDRPRTRGLIREFVREYFELNGFLVRQQRKYIAQTRREDDDIDFFVFNPQPRQRAEPLPFILATEDLPGIVRAVVVVKGWHTETFSHAVLANAPEIFRFVEPAVFKRAAESFGDDGSLIQSARCRRSTDRLPAVPRPPDC